jgi:hypothetical protein
VCNAGVILATRRPQLRGCVSKKIKPERTERPRELKHGGPSLVARHERI